MASFMSTTKDHPTPLLNLKTPIEARVTITTITIVDLSKVKVQAIPKVKNCSIDNKMTTSNNIKIIKLKERFFYKKILVLLHEISKIISGKDDRFVVYPTLP